MSIQKPKTSEQLAKEIISFLDILCPQEGLKESDLAQLSQEKLEDMHTKYRNKMEKIDERQRLSGMPRQKLG